MENKNRQCVIKCKERKIERKKDRDAKEIQTQRLTEQARLSF